MMGVVEEEGYQLCKHTNTAFTRLSLSVNDSNCKDTVSDSQNKRDQVYRAAAVDPGLFTNTTAGVAKKVSSTSTNIFILIQA